MMLKLTQSFEFSASHRLAIPTLSDSENRELFGKCSNPHGHGHNYILEVTVAGEPIQPDGALTNVGIIDRIVRENIIDAFDHKNLNSECPEFSDLNPTVENIAAVIFTKLTDKFVGSQLDRVRVWETPKTSAEVTRDQTRG
jgi:6-pyruvoyltetrahydropterin/6-carboxytetrahydropterin synthase